MAGGGRLLRTAAALPSYPWVPAHPAPITLLEDSHAPVLHFRPARTIAVAALGILGALAVPATSQAAVPAVATSASSAGTSSPPVYLVAVLDGRNVVPAGAGDPDGQAVEVLRVDGDRIDVAVRWTGLHRPTAAHLHGGVFSENGPALVRLPTPRYPGERHLVTGSVIVHDPALLARLTSDPTSFYVDLDTTRHPFGALRGQLHAVGHPIDLARAFPFAAAVRTGEQIYACTRLADGTFGFTQHNVEAHLRRGIEHSFVADDAGPPQWVARDHSAVTGTVVTRTPHGAGNIAELDLNLTQTGAARGLLAHAVEVLRLNTVGGVAPAGACDPVARPIARVPYQADYLFIAG